MTTTSNLQYMPHVAMDKILEYVDFKSLFSLRNVCRDFRAFIDVRKPDVRLKIISICFDSEKISASYNYQPIAYTKEIIHVDYRKQENGCIVQVKNKRTLLENVHYFDVFFKDFQSILSSQKSVLPILRISAAESNEELHDQFFETLGKLLKTRRFILKVSVLHAHFAKRDHLLSILPFLQPKILEELYLNPPVGVYGKERYLDMDEIVELDQWKQAKKIVMRFRSDAPLKKFIHFNEISTLLESASLEDVMLLKEKFISTAEKRSVTMSIKDLDSLEQILGRPSESRAGFSDEWFYRIHGSDKILCINRTGDFLAFYQWKAKNLPRNSIFKN